MRTPWVAWPRPSRARWRCRSDLTCPGPADPIPLRFYDPRAEREPGPRAFFHGSGFVIGDLEVYNALCTEIAHHP